MLKEIPGYENYLINESGVIINKKDNNVLRTSVNNDGYMYVYLEGKIQYIHNLVAKSFLSKENELELENVIHLDEDPLNNHISNIQYSDDYDKIELISREHRVYSNGNKLYEVYNEEIDDYILCHGRSEVAELIQYEEISLKNMVGNGRKITLGPYKGYQIRRLT